MSSFEKKRRREPHLKIPENVTESQLLIFLGEEALERAHRVSHGIEETVQRLLGGSPDSSCSISPDQADQILSNRHAGNEQGEITGAVDNRKRRW